MAKPEMYYSLVQEDDIATIDIFGDITSWPWLESDMSSYRLCKVLEKLDGVNTIIVNINSYGGEVAEGLAIYNTLKDFPAKIITKCSGFACSAASVVFMAGDERIMSDASLLMIHQAWMSVSGNADELRKYASDLDIITSASVTAYLSRVNISEDEVIALLKEESWIKPEDAVSMGFATSTESTSSVEAPGQSARKAIFEMIIKASMKKDDVDDESEDDDKPDDEDDDDEVDDSDSDPDDKDRDDDKKNTKASERLANFLLGGSN